MERIGLEPGSEIGGYTIVAPLGSGGMGTVYRAVDGGQNPVALKLLHPHVGADAVARERLRREVAALQRLRHPAVAAVLDAEADSTEAFLVTELVDGRNLSEHVRELGPLSPDELVALAAGLRDALDAVHDAGVVHRDLKPSNVVVSVRGPVLIDFGIAQAADDDARVTSTGFVLGTPGYLAPELVAGGEPSEASDWWGWAAVLAFAATGRDPFGTRPIDAVLARATAGDVDVAGLGVLTAGALRGALTPTEADRTAPDDVVAALEVAAADGDLPPGEDSTVVLDTSMPPTAATVVAAQDGRTVAFAAAPPEPDPDDDEDDEALIHARPVDVDDPVEWIEGDLDASEDLGDDGSGYERPVARRRWVALLAVGVLVGCLAALFPLVVLIVVLVLVVVVRAIGSTVEGMHTRRERAGVRGSDVLRAVATSPWHLVRTLVALVPSLLVSASAMVIVGGVLWWLIDNGTLTLGALGPGDEVQGPAASLAVALVVMLGITLVWFGPLSRMTRVGARRVLAWVAPGLLGTLVVVVVCLVGALVAVAAVRHGADIVWSPASVPTLPQ
ncbi:serine/threonine-protein kinase [Cellulomonas sp. HZM]|uniref:protein kinase domain-containing protein n=1 Tax=Cellulomonas sp. HZM TaxID=1454010 RepID=UPI000493A256|nr:serine/threonine-protein kinase [Cellulomonas sp. HZM]